MIYWLSLTLQPVFRPPSKAPSPRKVPPVWFLHPQTIARNNALPMSVPPYKAHSVPLPGCYPHVPHRPPLLDVHMDDATEVQSVLSQSEAGTVISHPAPRPAQHGVPPGSSRASKRSSASSKHSSGSQCSASFRSVDALAIKPCKDYSQYGP